jgi:hypothetical protein
MPKEIIIFKEETLLESSAAICWGDGIFSFLKKDIIKFAIILLKFF